MYGAVHFLFGTIVGSTIHPLSIIHFIITHNTDATTIKFGIRLGVVYPSATTKGMKKLTRTKMYIFVLVNFFAKQNTMLTSSMIHFLFHRPYIKVPITV